MTTLMTTSRTALGGLLALALAPALWPGEAAAHTCDAPFSTDLIAGRTIDAGDVEVCNDDATLTVTYEATFPWCLLATNLHVATIPDPPAQPDDNIPQNGPGNPTPDEFAYGDDYGGCLDRPAVFEIPLDEIDGGVSPGDMVAIAAHAEVEDGERAEGAWGEGPRFVERGNWAMYFTYEVQEGTCNTPGGSCTVFVTSTRHTGNLGGLAGADAICQARAESLVSAAPPGTYKAWLSTSAASAASRLTHATVPYRLVDGTQIADDWDDLTDGTLDAPINRQEDGILGFISQVWTGTAADGSFAGSDCAAWTDESPPSPPPEPPATAGVTGTTGATDFQWTFEAIQLQCNPQLRLYCLQQ
jgi:Protein of unknown function (DUF1554)